MHIVFVCTGNICRSPFAERYAAKISRESGLTHRFSSVGIAALTGSPMEPLMAERLQAHGGDPTNFIARQMEYETVHDADLVLALEGQHRQAVIDENPLWHRKVFLLRTAARTAAQAPAGVDRIAYVQEQRPQRRPGDSIPDPYRRGPAAADKAAEAIVATVDQLLMPNP